MRELHRYAIVRHAGFEASGNLDEEICEELDVIKAATPDQAVSVFCNAFGVHVESFETVNGRVWHEWYEAEEVGA